MLYGVAPVDAPTLLAVVALLSTVSIAACLKPTWSATSSDPVHALRAE